MSILVCGSLAYDSIMVFGDRFRNHILPDQIHILNVSFLVPDMRREFGGVAGNIAYNLKLLGCDPIIMATLGEDADPYRRRLDRLGISREHVREVPGTFTAQAFITTDLDDNQITAFHPGAMQHAHLNRVRDVAGVRLAIVSPDGREGMLRHVEGLAERLGGVVAEHHLGSLVPQTDHAVPIGEQNRRPGTVDDLPAQPIVRPTAHRTEPPRTLGSHREARRGDPRSQ